MQPAMCRHGDNSAGAGPLPRPRADARHHALNPHQPPSYHYTLNAYQLVGIPNWAESGLCDTPCYSVTECCQGLTEIGVPDPFAPLGHRIRACDVRVRINPARTYKVLDLRIRYFGLQNAIHRGKAMMRPSVKATHRTRCSILKLSHS